MEKRYKITVTRYVGERDQALDLAQQAKNNGWEAKVDEECLEPTDDDDPDLPVEPIVISSEPVALDIL